ncbi:MAG: hypothetical protein M1816_000623 [Peltula sp. TS41687]|nr:MAG: hypothetical protein M1816_000623 [Peltula sp. TS41687]
MIAALCRLAEPIALTSIFPYAFPLVKQFHVGDEAKASVYAGFFISAFAFSESLTGLFWGGVSDRIGRKPVLLFGCAGTILSLLTVGLATNFWVALVGRAIGGLLNGNLGVVQTMVGELVKRPEYEPRAYAVIPFVWSIGTIIGPAIGGTLVDPAKSFPWLFPPSGVFGTFPYLLPNLICAVLLLFSIVVGDIFLEETHSDRQPWSTAADLLHTNAETPLMATAGATEHAGADLRAESYGTFNAVEITGGEDWLVNSDGSRLNAAQMASESERTFTYRVIMLVIALGIFTYHSMTYDHLLPIFLQDDVLDDSAGRHSPLHIPGGLGLSTRAVGLIMSINGLIAMFIQAVIFPIFADWLGVWRVFLFVNLLHPIAYFIVPFLAVLPHHLLYPGIYFCLTIRNFFSILAYPVILILLKEAAPSHSVLGKINGLAASAGGACRTAAPPVAGYLYSLGTQIGFTGLAWWGSGLVAIAGSIQGCFVEREKYKKAHVQSAAQGFPRATAQAPKSEVIHITVDAMDD